MKTKIGKIALWTGIIDFFIYLILTGSAISSGVYDTDAIAFFGITLYICFGIALICLGGNFIRFIGKKFGEGYQSSQQAGAEPTVFCTNCGKKINASAAFCPHCGEKTN